MALAGRLQWWPARQRARGGRRGAVRLVSVQALQNAPVSASPDPRARLLDQRLCALAAAGALALNAPLLLLWNHPASVAGLPLVPLALFGLWAGLIGALAWLLERGG